MIKKKVKKIPKYKNGTPTVKPYVDDFSFSNSIGEHWLNMSGNAKADAVAGGIGALGTMVSNATSGQPVTAGGVISGIGSGAAAGAAIGGPWGAVAGGILGGVTAGIGRGSSYDSNSSSTSFNDIYQSGSGIASLFDDDRAARIGANMVQNNNIAKVQTEQMKAKYMNNPNVQTQPVLVAEGGIVPGEHYASRREVEVSKDGTNAVRYPWDPNGKDTYHVYTNPDGSSTEGNYVFTEEGVKRPNGEKYSDAAEKIIKGTKEGSKLRQISLRKLANEMEEQKMGKEIKKMKNGIPAHEGGNTGTNDSRFGIIRRNSIAGRWFEDYYKGQEANKTKAIEQFFDFVKNGGEYRVNDHGGVEVKQDGKWYLYQDTFDFSTRDLASVNGFSTSKYITPEVLKMAEYVKGNYGIRIPELPRPEIDLTVMENINRGLSKYNPVNFYSNASEDPRSILEKIRDINNLFTTHNSEYPSKKDVKTKSSAANSPVDDNVPVATPKHLTEEIKPVSLAAATKTITQSSDPRKAEMVRLTPDQIKQIGDDHVKLFNPEVERGQTDGFKWQDALYKSAVLTQPLWGRAKAEPVRADHFGYQYLPTNYDISDILSNNYKANAIANYNIGQYGSSTGLYLASANLAAADLMRANASARIYQKNKQNELISKNIGIYNDWSNKHTEILNDVHNKTAANRASARKINSQNMSAALSNYGQILRDGKQNAVAMMKFAALKPAISATYEDASANDVYKWYKELFG